MAELQYPIEDTKTEKTAFGTVTKYKWNGSWHSRKPPAKAQSSKSYSGGGGSSPRKDAARDQRTSSLTDGWHIEPGNTGYRIHVKSGKIVGRKRRTGM